MSLFPRQALWAIMVASAAVSRAGAAGTVAAEFLRFPVGAAAGMGEASGSITQDSTALYWNPAGLAALTTPDVYISHDSLPLTLRQDFVSAAVPLNCWNLPGVVGYSLQALTQSSIASLDNAGNPAGSYSATDMAHTLGWAARYSDFRMGAALRFIRQSIAGVSGSAVAFDGGVQKDLSDLWTLGAGLANMGSDLKLGSQSAPLPRTERAGVGLRLFDGEFLAAGDVSHVQSIGTRGHLGVQYRLLKGSGISVRGGYTFPKNSDDAYSGAAWGMSLEFRSFRADFSYQPYGDLGNSFQFGLGYRFGSSGRGLSIDRPR